MQASLLPPRHRHYAGLQVHHHVVHRGCSVKTGSKQLLLLLVVVPHACTHPARAQAPHRVSPAERSDSHRHSNSHRQSKGCFELCASRTHTVPEGGACTRTHNPGQSWKGPCFTNDIAATKLMPHRVHTNDTRHSYEPHLAHQYAVYPSTED